MQLLSRNCCQLCCIGRDWCRLGGGGGGGAIDTARGERGWCGIKGNERKADGVRRYGNGGGAK